MSDIRNVMKGGWHPKGKDGGKESWRGDFKGINQVAGWMGKGKLPGSNAPAEHVSRPLATLKDPSSFGPPPRNVNYHGGAALPNEITPHTGGLGAPLTKQEIDSANESVQRISMEEVEEEEQKSAGPPLPYRADRTGLQTNHLPPPPVHRDIIANTNNTQAQVSKIKPGLPPRLPERRNTSEVTPPVSSPPPAYDNSIPPPKPKNSLGYKASLGQTATTRLGNAGVSVPGLGIGTSESNPWKNEKGQTPKSPPTTQQTQPITSPSSMTELQSRFARMNSNSSNYFTPPTTARQTPAPVITPEDEAMIQADAAPPTYQGTVLTGKEAAYRTAQKFHKDPSSVSISEAQSAATTANNFRERHQDSISAGASKASTWNKKYNVTGRLNTFLEKQSSGTENASPQNQSIETTNSTPQASNLIQSPGQTPKPELTASISRKPPPPPPPAKKPGLTATAGATAAPPPVPIGTKPSFG